MKKIYLMPLRFRAVARAVRRVAIVAVILTVFGLLIMAVSGVFQDVTTAVTYSAVMLSVVALLLIRGFRHKTISQSTVEFSSDRINVFNGCGRCWREILYDSITDIRVENVSGHFYGDEKQQPEDQYICFYLNGTTQIPIVSFGHLLKHPDFFMIAYDESLKNIVQQWRRGDEQ